MNDRQVEEQAIKKELNEDLTGITKQVLGEMRQRIKNKEETLQAAEKFLANLKA